MPAIRFVAVRRDSQEHLRRAMTTAITFTLRVAIRAFVIKLMIRRLVALIILANCAIVRGVSTEKEQEPANEEGRELWLVY